MFFPLENATVLSGKQKNNKGGKGHSNRIRYTLQFIKSYMSINVWSSEGGTIITILQKRELRV